MRKSRGPSPSGDRAPGALVALEDPVVLGRVTKPHGLGGACRVAPYGDERSALVDADRLWVEVGPPDAARRWRPLAVESVQPQRGMLLVRFAGIETLEGAEALRDRELAVPRAALPEPEEDEYYWRDLIGLRVLDAGSGEDLGTVESLMAMPGADNLVIRAPDGAEWMLPFTDENVAEVDLAGGAIRVTVPPGLRERDE